jgi:hypothetical protein
MSEAWRNFCNPGTISIASRRDGGRSSLQAGLSHDAGVLSKPVEQYGPLQCSLTRTSLQNGINMKSIGGHPGTSV